MKQGLGFTRDQMNQANLASIRGTLEALTTNAHLGVAVKKYGYSARTLTGDAFETAFEWGREERRNRGCLIPCEGGSRCPCYRAGFFNDNVGIDD